MAQIGLNLNYGARVDVSWSAEVPDCMGIFIACDSRPGHPLARDTVHLYGTPEAFRALADKMRAALPAEDTSKCGVCPNCDSTQYSLRVHGCMSLWHDAGCASGAKS